VSEPGTGVGEIARRAFRPFVVVATKSLQQQRSFCGCNEVSAAAMKSLLLQ
jgi:hypothetical protein